MLVNENHRIFAISTDAIENLSTCIGKVRIRLSVQVSVIIQKFIPHPVDLNYSKLTNDNTFFPTLLP